MHLYIHTHTYTYAYIHNYREQNSCAHVCICTYTYLLTHTYAYIHNYREQNSWSNREIELENSYNSVIERLQASQETVERLRKEIDHWSMKNMEIEVLTHVCMYVCMYVYTCRTPFSSHN